MTADIDIDGILATLERANEAGAKLVALGIPKAELRSWPEDRMDEVGAVTCDWGDCNNIATMQRLWQVTWLDVCSKCAFKPEG